MDVFKSLPVAKDTVRFDRLSGCALDYVQDAITLEWIDRAKSRAPRESDSGFAFATTLRRGTVLREDDCFVFDAHRRVIRVVEQAEPVLVIRPDHPRQWAVFAYQIGNSHQPLMIDADAMVCPDVLGMAQVLEFHGIPFVREDRKFTPLGFVADHQHGAVR